MKKTFFQICAIAGVVAAMCVLAVGCSATPSQSSSAGSSESSDTSSTMSAASSFLSGASSATESAAESTSENITSTDFWEGSKYANPSQLPLDEKFIKAYAEMKGIEDVQFGSLSVSDTAEVLTIPFTATFAPFEWEGTEYIPVLSQMEVKLGNGGTVIQTYLSMPGEEDAWVMCAGTDTYKGTEVQVRIRAAINPLGGNDSAYSEWSDWQTLTVEAGPAKGEEKAVEHIDTKGLAQ